MDVLGPLALRVEATRSTCPAPGAAPCWRCSPLEGDRGRRHRTAGRLALARRPAGERVQALYNHVSRLRGHLGPLADRLERQAAGTGSGSSPTSSTSTPPAGWRRDDPGRRWRCGAARRSTEFRSLPRWRSRRSGSTSCGCSWSTTCSRHGWRGGPDGGRRRRSPPRRRRRCESARRCCTCGRWRRTVRTAEAMAAAQAFRRRLVDETGLDPTPALADAGAAGRLGPGRRGAPSAGRRGPTARWSAASTTARRWCACSAPTPSSRSPGPAASARPGWRSTSPRWRTPRRSSWPLAVVDRADRVGQAVASSLGLRITGEVRPDDVAAALADRELLLVLDNCEHVADACRELVAARAARARRPRARHVAGDAAGPGEYVVRLQPLPVPRDVPTSTRCVGSRACAPSSSTRAGATPGYELGRRQTPPTSSRCCAASTACRSASSWPRGRSR